MGLVFTTYVPRGARRKRGMGMEPRNVVKRAPKSGAMAMRLNDRSLRRLIATATRRRDVWDTVAARVWRSQFPRRPLLVRCPLSASRETATTHDWPLHTDFAEQSARGCPRRARRCSLRQGPRRAEGRATIGGGRLSRRLESAGMPSAAGSTWACRSAEPRSLVPAAPLGPMMPREAQGCWPFSDRISRLRRKSLCPKTARQRAPWISITALR